MFKHILFPTDGSELSTKAAKKVVQFACELGAKVTVVHVSGRYHAFLESEGFTMPDVPALRKRIEAEKAERAKQILGEVTALAKAAGVACATVEIGNDVAYEAIIKEAKKSKCDLIMMASHGRRGLQSLLLGSETQKVLTHSKIPVLVCR